LVLRVLKVLKGPLVLMDFPKVHKVHKELREHKESKVLKVLLKVL
jgi:hypothetical protein